LREIHFFSGLAAEEHRDAAGGQGRFSAKTSMLSDLYHRKKQKLYNRLHKWAHKLKYGSRR
jgi:hypothetical protein